MRDRNAIMRDIDKAFAGCRAVNVLRVASAVADGETVTIGSDVYEADIGNGITAGHILVDLSAGGTKASGTLTSDNTNVANNDTVTIDTKVYTFKTSLTPAEGEVLIGADADSSLLNLIRAINHTGTAGTDYSCAAVHPTVTAAASVTAHAFVVTAKLTGTGANAIATTETSAHLSFGATTLASGANPTAAQFITAFVTAVNTLSNQGVYSATAIGTSGVVISTIQPGNYTIACTETLAGSNNAWAAAAMYGGEGRSVPQNWRTQRVPLATEVTLGVMQFCFPFTPTKVNVSVKVTSSGAAKAWDGAVTISGNIVTVDNAGSTDWAATDTVLVYAQA